MYEVSRDLSNCYTRVCPPVHGDTPLTTASGLSPVQVNNHGVTIYIYVFCTTYISVDLARYEIFRAKVSKGWY